VAQAKNQVKAASGAKLADLNGWKSTYVSPEAKLKVAWDELAKSDQMGAALDDAIKRWKPSGMADNYAKNVYMEKRGLKQGLSRVFQGKLVPLEKIPLEVQQRLVTQIMDSKSPELAQLKKGLDRTVRVHVDKIESVYAKKYASLKEEYQAAMRACGTGPKLLAAGQFCDLRKMQKLKQQMAALKPKKGFACNKDCLKAQLRTAKNAAVTARKSRAAKKAAKAAKKAAAKKAAAEAAKKASVLSKGMKVAGKAGLVLQAG
jgi:hypothetical protein